MGSDRLQSCVLWAAEQHTGQWRDGEAPIPYICHPLEVLSTLRYQGKVTDEDMMCAAVLHDVLEETSATSDEVESHFGKGVADLVKELTRVEPEQETIAGMSKDDIWELRAQMLLDEVAQMSPRAMTVKLCDRISNLEEAKFVKSAKKLERYERQTRQMLKIIPRKTNTHLWDLLDEKVNGRK